ncbi:MAG: PTS lactose/cellobiose transporter subunit IIA, partial [Bacilli bacterium]
MDLTMVAFSMITHVGNAKSLFMEALHLAKQGDFEASKKLIDEGELAIIEAHKVHADLIQKEASGEKVEIGLLLMHAEDQLLSTETIKLLIVEIIEIHQLISK